MKINNFTALLILIIFASCSTLKFSEADLKWQYGEGNCYNKIVIINDSIIVEEGTLIYDSTLISKSRYIYNRFVLDSNGTKTIDIINLELKFDFGKENKLPIESSSKGHIYSISVNDNFNFVIYEVRYDRIFRWQDYDKTKLIIIRKTDAFKKVLRFKISDFRSIYQVIPFGENKLLISYNIKNKIGNKIGMIDLDKLFEE